MTETPAHAWRRRLRREVSWALLIKLALLLLLWALFFSPAHRLRPDGDMVSDHLSLPEPSPPPPSGADRRD